MMKIRFWGVRGSIPCPGPHTAKYGGNGACVELRAGDDDQLIIIDAGSGIRELGNHLMKYDLPNGPIAGKIFLTHTHWDHIMGFPYFTPIYVPGTKLDVYGPVTFEDDPLEDVVGGQMKYRYFPVNVGELASDLNYFRLKEIPDGMGLDGGVRLTTKILNHPITALGYRFEYNGRVFCTCYDHEPYRNLFITDTESPEYDEAMAYEGEEVAKEQNQAVEDFFAGADLLVHDTQYTKDEYGGRVGWGHSFFEHAIQAAARAGVKRLALFHHDPDRTDNQIDELARIYCEPGKYGDIEVFFARDGMEIDI